MPKLRTLSGKDLLRIFGSFGFEQVSQKGSHIKLRRTLPSGTRQNLTIIQHDVSGKAVFEKILAFAESKEMPIRWGAVGFSLNVDLEEVPVAICFCWPPKSVYSQSIYTNRAGIITRTKVPEDEITKLWSEAKLSGFQPAGQELKFPIDRSVSDTDISKILSWCGAMVEAVVKYGLKR